MLQIYLQMLKNHRSMSQILQKNQPSDLGPNQGSVFEINKSKRKQGHEQLATDNSKLSLAQAKSTMKTLHQTSTRNRSLSCSRLKLFEKAHQVGKNESYQRQSIVTNPKTLCLSASNQQLTQYKHHKKQAKLAEIVEKKLIITKVLHSMEDQNRPRLTIRRELQLKKDSVIKKASEIQEDMAESKLPSDLIYSKEGFYQSKLNVCSRCQDEALTIKNELSFSRDQEALKNYSKQLTLSVQQSIKKQMDEHYLAKERELAQRYHQKELQYAQKLKELESIMAAKLEKQRNLLLQNINQELEKQFEKVKEATSQIKIEQQILSKNNQKIEKEQKIEKVQKIQKSQRKQSTTSRENKIQNQTKIIQTKNDAISKSGSRKGSANIPSAIDTIQQIKTVEKRMPSPPTQPPKTKTNQYIPPIKKQQKIQKNTNQKQQSLYNNNDSILEQIEQVKLETNPQKNKQNNSKKSEGQNERINQSFNIEKKLNDSFSSQRPVIRKQEVPSKPASKMKREISEEERKKTQEQERKTFVRNKLKQQVQNDTILIAIGEVAGYCSKYCKKSKVDWRIPSLLLYRYCLDFFRSYKDIYEEAERLKLIKKEELQNYISYDKVMEENLNKMYKSIQKKVTIKETYKAIIDSQSIEVQRLRPYAVLQARNYVKQLKKSSESNPQSGDMTIVQCGLRIINSVFIIKKLNGQPSDIITCDIEKLSKEETFALFEEWSDKLRQEQ